MLLSMEVLSTLETATIKGFMLMMQLVVTGLYYQVAQIFIAPASDRRLMGC